MFVPLGRVRHSIDILQKNIYEYHHGSNLSLSTNSIRYPSANNSKPRRCPHLIQLIEDSCTIIQAIFVRFIFILSTVVAVWRLVEETKQIYYWYLLLLLIFLLIESYVMIIHRKGYEYKWFCSSAFAYLIAIVPCIWLLELNYSLHVSLLSNGTKISLDIRRRFQLTTSSNGFSNDFDADDSNSKENSIIYEHVFAGQKKKFTSTELTTTKTQDLNLKKLLQRPQEFILKLNTHLSREEWHMIIEQMTLLVLILSRWLLPKGELTREELSQLLLVYIGIAADIIEFFEVFKEKSVRTNSTLSILVLLLWTLSLLQYCLAFTISRGRKARLVLKTKQEKRYICSPSDFWGMLISLFLQDIPFFSFRAVLIFHYHIFSYSTVFFTSKNGLIIILQWYRITVILATTISEERRNHRHNHKKLIPIIEITPNGRTINNNEDLSEQEESTYNV
ncbi:unnamed protein product [Rotaria magnacalcarata]|uniref:Transmembrane protein 26 n=1 Tax=Rotaria magnacalcarata TaxID=392030 RepID=A0A816TVM4_9BILA|nr:unnamed protein product [Rotaria magnacalcarata]CAF1553335.1 unnamed protein product [Rotaria magnacalcarata]CAF2043019.1 unnamed protein product [Rotaria magnacalcarata]CAF2101366.1 unnamed protein product [Rotaria magnacalcarata]CAF3725497.1 unnamed protein product [Rotaria magnacalcarata]